MEISERLYIVMGSIEFCVNAALLSPASLSLSLSDKKLQSILRDEPYFLCVCVSLSAARVDARVGGAVGSLSLLSGRKR